MQVLNVHGAAACAECAWSSCRNVHGTVACASHQNVSLTESIET